jgi:membrane-bound serine protease (ClpP class)
MRLRIFVGLLWVSLGVALVLGQSQAQSSFIAYAELESSINPITKDFLLRVITEAHRDGASLLVIRLDTPGGLLESTKDMVTAILNSPIPIVIWVGPAGARAASAGAFITMAADIAAMAEGTNIGSSTPISLGPAPGEGESQDDPARKKILEFVASEARKIAEKRGRSKEWAEKFVLEGKSLTAQEALQNNIINLIANSREELLKQLDGYELQRDGQTVRLQTAGMPLKIYERTFKEQVMNYLADPNVVYLLLTIGIYALIAEFFTPGFGVGIGGAICLLLALLGLQVLPFNIAGLAFILLGAALMVIDLFTPTHLALTVGGVISLLIGSFMLFNFESFEAPALGLARQYLCDRGDDHGAICLYDHEGALDPAQAGGHGQGRDDWGRRHGTGRAQPHGDGLRHGGVLEGHSSRWADQGRRGRARRAHREREAHRAESLILRRVSCRRPWGSWGHLSSSP